MADIHNRQTRSYNMSCIKAKDTKPELLVRRFLHNCGYRYKLYDKSLPGKPDVVLPRFRTVIFIHGCFWHGHSRCKFFKVPKTRTKWWSEKINRNKLNDSMAIRTLRKEGWKVIVIWECGLRPAKLETTLLTLFAELSMV